jgi:hypothetical protein
MIWITASPKISGVIQIPVKHEEGETVSPYASRLFWFVLVRRQASWLDQCPLFCQAHLTSGRMQPRRAEFLFEGRSGNASKGNRLFRLFNLVKNPNHTICGVHE